MTDFGVEMRQLMAQASVSMRELARRTRFDVGYLSRVANGRQDPSQALAEVLDKALGADGALAALASGEPFEAAEVPGLTVEQFAGGRIGEPEVCRVERALNGLTAMDDAQGGDVLHGIAAGYLSHVQKLLNTTTYGEKVGCRLQIAAGRVAEQAGWLAFDAYQHDVARRYFHEALYMAQLADDEQLRILTLASISMQSHHVGRLQESVAAAQAARELAERIGAPARLKSELCIREAYGRAMMHDSGFQRMLHLALREFERSETPPATSWFAFYGDEAHLLTSKSACHGLYGDHHTAVQSWRQAMVAHDQAYVRNTALYNLAFSESLFQVGQTDEAYAVASSGAELLCQQVMSTRARSKLRRFVDLVRPHRQKSTVARSFLNRYAKVAT